MKRLLRSAVILTALLCLLTGVASADALREKTFVYNGSRWPASENAATFWEAPVLAAGESCTDGSLTLENASPDTVTLTLTGLGLPHDDPEQMAYLSALQLQLRQGDKLLYSGSYAHLLSSERPVLQAELQPGEARVYTVSLSCPFAYSGGGENHPVVSWTFDSAVSLWEEPAESDPGDTTGSSFTWPLDQTRTIALICGVVAVGLFALAIVLIVGLIRGKRK